MRFVFYVAKPNTKPLESSIEILYKRVLGIQNFFKYVLLFNIRIVVVVKAKFELWPKNN